MNIPSTVRSFLSDRRVKCKARMTTPAESFEATVALAELPLNKVIKPVMLCSGSAYLMAIIRADQSLDIEALNTLFKRQFRLCNAGELQELFPNCDNEALPPLGEPYGLRAIIDASIDDLNTLFFSSGSHGTFIAVERERFIEKLQEGSWKGRSITLLPQLDTDADEGDETASPASSMRKTVRQVDELPAMPGLAAEIIRIRNNPYTHASELAAVIEQDPSLSAQVIRYATSPLYAYQGKIHSVEQAIVRVLGVDFVEDLAFGLSLGKAFNNPREGMLGLDAFWRHALYSATLTQALCGQIEFSRRPPASTGYLAGLLHNFGLLLLGHLFPAQFERLATAVEKAPDRSLQELERETIAVSHTELGLWLMDAWEMPKEIVEAVGEHHNPDHRGDYSVYANLVYIANALLKRHGIGDAPSTEIPQEMLNRFKLDEEKLTLALATVLQGEEELEFMVQQMAA